MSLMIIALFLYLNKYTFENMCGFRSIYLHVLGKHICMVSDKYIDIETSLVLQCQRCLLGYYLEHVNHLITYNALIN